MMLRRRRVRSQRIAHPSLADAHSRKWLPFVAVQALDHLGAGVIVTDSGSAVVEMNRAGEAILRLEDGLLIRNGRLCARRVFETTKIAKLIAGATAGGGQTGGGRGTNADRTL